MAMDEERTSNVPSTDSPETNKPDGKSQEHPKIVIKSLDELGNPQGWAVTKVESPYYRFDEKGNLVRKDQPHPPQSKE